MISPCARAFLPDDPTTREQFLTTRMVETGPGTVKLNNPRGSHDDIPTVVGMLVATLSATPEVGRGGITVPRGTIPGYRDRMNAYSRSRSREDDDHRGQLDPRTRRPLGIMGQPPRGVPGVSASPYRW